MKREIYLKMTRKRVRVTFSLGMVFTTKKIPTLTNISRVYLNLNCCEQDDDNVQNNDPEEWGRYGFYPRSTWHTGCLKIVWNSFVNGPWLTMVSSANTIPMTASRSLCRSEFTWRWTRSSCSSMENQYPVFCISLPFHDSMRNREHRPFN